MWKKTDPSYVRISNQLAVLSTIFSMGTTSRSELARTLKLSKPSVSDNLIPLLEMGIVKEPDPDHLGGCKPRLVQFNHKFRYMIALDLHYDDPIFALGDLNGEIIDRLSIKVANNAPSQARISLILNGIQLLMHANNIQPDLLAAIAISAPGIYTNNTLLTYANKQHANLDMEALLQVLRENFHTDVFFQNDAKAAAIGELNIGVGQGAENLVYIRCGLGIGAGIVLDGKKSSAPAPVLKTRSPYSACSRKSEAIRKGIRPRTFPRPLRSSSPSARSCRRTKQKIPIRWRFCRKRGSSWAARSQTSPICLPSKWWFWAGNTMSLRTFWLRRSKGLPGIIASAPRG